MENGSAAEDFVFLSRVRTGLKREFEFALKVQTEICGSLGRTRSGKALNGPVASPGKRSNKKLKNEESKVEKEKSDLEKSVKVMEEPDVLMSEEEAESDVVDVEEEEEGSKRVGLEKEEEVKDGLIETVSEDGVDEEGKEPKKMVIASEEERVEELKESKMDVGTREKEAGGLENTANNIEEDKGNEDVVVESQNFSKNIEEEKGKEDLVVESENMMNSVEEEKGKEDLTVESEPCIGDIGTSALVNCEGDSKVENGVKEEKPLRRFTRSLLKPKVETVKETALKDDVVVDMSDVKSGEDDGVEGEDSPMTQDMDTSANHVRNFPTQLNDLFDSGMLEGLNVRYSRSSKVWLRKNLYSP